jgi:hypothetical protein
LLKGGWPRFDGYFRTSRCIIPPPEKANSLYVGNTVFKKRGWRMIGLKGGCLSLFGVLI